MSTQENIQRLLTAGIEAARQGDKARARQLLEGVLRYDEDNELAWIWLASAVETPRERRICLERVLRINPDNQRAQTALKAMGDAGQNAPASRRPVPPYIWLIGLFVLVVFLVSQFLGPQATTEVISTSIPTNTPVLFTATPSLTPTFPGVRVDLEDRDAPTLPPTFTPTPTETPTPTLPPTTTPFALADFTLIVASRADDVPQPDLQRILGDGTGGQVVAANMRDVSYSADGSQIIFVRDVEYPPDETQPEPLVASEVFIAPADDPISAYQVTTLRTANAYQPSLSPDGRLLVFVSDFGGNENLYTYDLTQQLLTPLTSDDAIDRHPHWSPDGRQIAFTSDRESPGFTEIFVLTFLVGEDLATDEDGDGIRITRLTNDPGSSYAPRWSPDGRSIVYVNDRTTFSDLYVVPVMGTRSNLVGGASRFEDRAPVWTPDGSAIVFISNREDGRFQVYLYDFARRTTTRVTREAREAQSVDVRPALVFRARFNTP